MYVIRNVGAHEVALGDLRVTLRPNQKLDLDMICSRFIAERSPSLQLAIKKGIIRIVQKDGTDFRKIEPRQADPVKTDDNVVTKEQLQEMEKRMTDTLTSQLRKLSHKEEAPVIDPQSLAALAPLIEKLTQIVQGTPQSAPKKEEPEEIDEKLVDIHARSLDRMNRQVDGNIKHQEQIDQGNIDDRAKELDSLL